MAYPYNLPKGFKMTHKKNALKFFKDNMQDVWELAVLPWAVLDKSIRDTGVSFGLFVLAGLFLTPPLLAAFAITATLGAVAALAVTIFFPFNYVFSAVRDVLASGDDDSALDPGNEGALDRTVGLEQTSGATQLESLSKRIDVDASNKYDNGHDSDSDYDSVSALGSDDVGRNDATSVTGLFGRSARTSSDMPKHTENDSGYDSDSCLLG